jgi:hypothetical protein
MCKCRLVISLVAIIAFFRTSAWAAIIDIMIPLAPPDLPWTFDYDLQQLTVTDVIYQMDPDAAHYMTIDGLVDSASTFKVIRNITNSTSVTWTGYTVITMMTILPFSASIVPDTAESTNLQTITYPEKWIIQFSGAPFVLPGESLTISFDMCTPPGTYTDEVWFTVAVCENPVPEPMTLSLLGLGGLVLLRKRKTLK